MIINVESIREALSIDSYKEMTKRLSSLLCIDKLLTNSEITEAKRDILVGKRLILARYDELLTSMGDSWEKSSVEADQRFIEELLASVQRNLELNRVFNLDRMDRISEVGIAPIILLDTHNVPGAFDLLRRNLDAIPGSNYKNILVEQFVERSLDSVSLQEELEKRGAELTDTQKAEYKLLASTQRDYALEQSEAISGLSSAPVAYMARLFNSDYKGISPSSIRVSEQESFVNYKYALPFLIDAIRVGKRVIATDVNDSGTIGRLEVAKSEEFSKVRELGFALHIAMHPNSIMVVGASHGKNIVDTLRKINPSAPTPICINPIYRTPGPEDIMLLHIEKDGLRYLDSVVELPDGCLNLNMSSGSDVDSSALLGEIISTGKSPIAPREELCVLDTPSALPASRSILSLGPGLNVKATLVSTLKVEFDDDCSMELNSFSASSGAVMPNVKQSLRDMLSDLKNSCQYMGTPVKIEYLMRMDLARAEGVQTAQLGLAFDAKSSGVISCMTLPLYRAPSLSPMIELIEDGAVAEEGKPIVRARNSI